MISYRDCWACYSADQASNSADQKGHGQLSAVWMVDGSGLTDARRTRERERDRQREREREKGRERRERERERERKRDNADRGLREVREYRCSSFFLCSCKINIQRIVVFDS